MVKNEIIQNCKKWFYLSEHEKKANYTWVRKCILSATCRGCSTWRPFMTLVIRGAQRDVRPWQCIPLPFGNDCAHTTFVSLMFTLSATEADSQPNVISHYGQVYISQKVYISRTMCIRLFFLFRWVLAPLKIFDTFITPCMS